MSCLDNMLLLKLPGRLALKFDFPWVLLLRYTTGALRLEAGRSAEMSEICD